MTDASQQSPPHPADPQPTAAPAVEVPAGDAPGAGAPVGEAPGAGAPDSAWDVPWPAAPRRARQPLRAAGVALAVCGSVGLLGIPLGLVWASVTPSIPVRKAEDAGALLADAQPEQFAAADAWFSLLGLGFGVAAAIGVWLLARRWRGPLVLLALTVGGVFAGLAAWWLGSKVGVGDYERMLASASPGTVLEKPGDLRAAEVEIRHGFLPVIRGNVLLPSLGAALSYTLMAGWSRFSSLRPGMDPDDPDDPTIAPEADGTHPPEAQGLSSDSTATPAPRAVPVPPGPDAAVPPRG